MMNALRLPFLLVLVLTATMLQAGTGTASAQASGIVTGIVTDAETSDPLAGASAALRSAGATHIVAGTVTNADGRYRIEGVATGSYVLTLSFVGYQRVEVAFTLEAGETETLNVTMFPGGIDLNTVVVTASRQQEKVLDAPASISVIEAREIQREVSTSVNDVLRNTPGVDMAQTGIDRREIVLRGFNNAFSGAVYTLTDYRPSAVPALNVNVYGLMPIPSMDIDRIEVVRGPGSALYGPGVDAGVIHFITKDPFTNPGTSVSVAGGERSYFAGQLRHAGVVNNRLGYKITGAYAQGDDWELGQDVLEPDSTFGEELFQRDNDYERMNLAGSVTYRIGGDASVTANAGYSSINSTVLTGVGTARAEGFGYAFGQLRFQRRGFFAQGTLNRNSGGDSYLYSRASPDGTPEPLIDNSIMLTLQAQQNLELMDGREHLVVGADYNNIRPDTEGSIYGRNEEDDQIQEVGAYVQSTTNLTPKLDLVAALRGDYVTSIETFALSPRAGLVFKPTPEHTLRATFNRAFSSPSARTLFLDIRAREASVGGTPFNIVLYGMGPHEGFTFNNFRSSGQVATNLPIPGLFGQPIPYQTVPLQPVYGVFAAQAGALLTSGAPLPAPLSGLNAQQRAAFAQILGSLTPFVPQTAFTAGTLGIPDPESALGYRVVSGPVDIAPLEPTTTNTFEVGYKGLFQNRVLFAIDGYYTQKNNFIGPLLIETPFVYIPGIGADLAATLAPIIQGAAAQDPQVAGFLQSLGLTPAQAAGLLGQLAQGGLGSNPVGIVQPDQAILPEGSPPTEVGGLVTYRNFGQVELFGIDASTQVMMTDALSLFANASWVSDNFFDADELGEENQDLALALNASKLKVKGGFDYAFPMGLSLGASARYIEGFPVRSGPYEGTVDNYVLVDLAAGFVFGAPAPGLRLDVTVHNLLDNEHREFVGAPELGRMALARLLYNF